MDSATPPPTAPPPAPQPAPLEVAIDELAEAWGPEARRLRELLTLLAGPEPQTPTALVRRLGLPHAAVSEVLDALSAWLEPGADERVRTAPAHRAAWTARIGAVEPPLDAVAAALVATERVGGRPELVAELDALRAAAPAPEASLDHLAATSRSALRRAAWLLARYDLGQAPLLLLGDHDLTSLALGLLSPQTPCTVVDVDDRVLGYLAEVAAARGWPLRTAFADLRVELPRGLTERFDLVLTDPPYSAAGVATFLARGLEALRSTWATRLLLCYGRGVHRPELGYKVQDAIHRLRLVVEAALPGFSAYDGAEAIGSRSTLWVLQPTRRSAAAAAATATTTGPQIYTHGAGAAEARRAVFPAAARDALRAAPATLLVGGGWPDELAPGADRTSLGGFLRTMRRTGATLREGSPLGGRVAVALAPHHDAYLPRVLLAAAAGELLVCCGPEAASWLTDPTDDPLRRLIAVRYQVRRHTPGDARRPAVLELEERPPEGLTPAEQVLREIVLHRGARLANAWRRAWVEQARAAGQTLTRNEARAAIREACPASVHPEAYLDELSRHALAQLTEAIGG